jgi:hypothetical protein
MSDINEIETKFNKIKESANKFVNNPLVSEESKMKIKEYINDDEKFMDNLFELIQIMAKEAQSINLNYGIEELEKNGK